MTGANLRPFVAEQLAFTAHVRDPDEHPVPAGIDPRRMQVYVDLVFNNIESLLAGAFPVARRVLRPEHWRGLIRQFVHHHASDSPYFIDLSQEFIAFLGDNPDLVKPAFLLELCHYEWVELALGCAEDPEQDASAGPRPTPGEAREAVTLAERVLVCAPLAWPLSYAYPVHRLSETFQPEAPPEHPTHLIVHRRADDSVGFLETTAATFKLLTLLDGQRSCRAAIVELLAQVGGAEQDTLGRAAREALAALLQAGILLDAR